MKNSSARKSTSRISDQKYSRSGRIEESPGGAIRRTLQKWIERKSRDHTGAHFTNTGVARKNALYEWVQRVRRCRIDLKWKIISRSQSTGSRSKFSICVEPRPRPAIWHMEFVWDTGKRVWKSTSSDRFMTDTLSRNSSHFESKCYRWKPCAEEYRETCRQKWRTKSRYYSNAEICRETVNHEFFLSGRRTTELYGWSAKTANLTSFISINSPFNVNMLEDKIQNPSKCLFRFSLGGYVMDQRSGVGRFGGWFKIIAINSCSFPEFRDAGRENGIFSEQDHVEFLPQEKGQSGGTESSERGSVPSRKTGRLLDLRLLSSHWCS